MNKWGLVAVVVMGVCCGGGLLFTSRMVGGAVENVKSARTWVDANLPPVMKTWDLAQLKPLLDPEFASRRTPADLQKTFDDFKKDPGVLKTYKSSTNTGYNQNMNNGQSELIVELDCEGDFSKRPAKFHVRLKKTAAGWKIAGLSLRKPETSVETKT